MAEVLSWQGTDDARGLLLRAVRTLKEGGLVAFPADSGYALAASPAHPAAVEQVLAASLPAPPELPRLALAVGGPAQALELLPGMSRMGRRLAKRCWPGPVTFVYPGELDRVPESIRGEVTARGGLALRSPAHSAILHALYELGEPLVIADIASGDPAMPQAAALVIDDGPPRFDRPPTVVRIDGDAWQVLYEGAVTAEQMRVQSACLVVFVCTGNTCRSPLAEALCKKRLAERVGRAVEELPHNGFVVLSAGVAAREGDPAAAEAIETAKEWKADLTTHASQPLDPYLAVQADYLVCMTESHRQTLLGYYAHLGCQPRLLSHDGTDLPDPIGQERPVYRACAEQIWRDLEALVAELSP